MIKQGLEFWANKDIRRRTFDVYVHKHQGIPGDPTVLIGQPVVFLPPPEEQKEDLIRGYLSNPPVTFAMSYGEAAQLMDELWGAGVRPSGVGSTGELAAVTYHLEDMRRLLSGMKLVKE